MKLAVFITCDNNYIPLSIVSLKSFQKYNSEYDLYIIGKSFKKKYKLLCEQYEVKTVEIDLSSDFINLDKRTRSKGYPIESFYHFYAYKLLDDYDYIVQIEPDIYTNKKLDVNLSDIKYIGGARNMVGNVYLRDMEYLPKIYEKFKNFYNTFDFDRKRIMGGFRIYKPKNLKKIQFYEKIIEYYQLSIKESCHICEDDTLMMVYQALNQKYINILHQKYNVIMHNMTLNDIDNIVHFHFGGYTVKYWKNSNRTGIDRYFTEKMIEFLYNNFDLKFIEDHIPTLYKDIKNDNLDFFYYKSNNVNNFGDIITPYFLKKYCKNYYYNSVDKNHKIISCGSVMRWCGDKTIVYGSGIMHSKQNPNHGIFKIVRGPLTRKRLIELGYYCPPVYGDPGLLLPLYYMPKIDKKYKLGIIPHHVHYNKVKIQYENETNVNIIKLDNDNVEKTIDQILMCEKIISSSLHGLIVSDAYDIPNKWIMFNDDLAGDNTKFYDYFESVHRKDQKYIDCVGFQKIDIDETITKIQDVQITFDKQELKDNMFFDENGIKNYTKYLYTIIIEKKADKLKIKQQQTTSINKGQTVGIIIGSILLFLTIFYLILF